MLRMLWENIIDSLHKLGIDYDEGPGKEGAYGPYYQSERLPIYHKYVQELIEKGYAYYCFCTKEDLDGMREEQQKNNLTSRYDGRCKNLTPEEVQKRLHDGVPYVVRLKMPTDKLFVIEDVVRGKVEIESSLIDDQVLLKSDKFPTYHLAAVIDDHLMEISHVIRGEEWLPSTPKHVYLYECLGWEPPQFVHLPLLLNTDRSKLSKRHGDFSVGHYLDMGYLREALVNFVALLGWHPIEDKELFTVQEMVEDFSFDRVNKAGAIFDVTKLDWMNGWYIRNLPIDRIAEEAKPYFIKAGIDISDRKKYLKVIERARDQISTLQDISQHAIMFYQELTFSEEDMGMLQNETAQRVLAYYYAHLQDKDLWTREELHELVKQGITDLEIKGKNYYFPLRLSMFGSVHGPEIPMLIDILGKEEAMKRIKKVLVQ